MMQFPHVRPAVHPAVRDALTPDITTPQTVIAGLFAAGQQGFWFPFTDFASLTQDSDGTLPYTALEQPVGRVLDRSGRGNHASQVTSTARGVVSARVNALQNTDNPAAWGYAGTRFSVGSKDVDDGWPLTALINSASFLAAVNTDYPIGASGVADTTIIRSIELQVGTASYVTFGGASSKDAVTIDLVSKVIVANLGACPVTITTLADNWIRVEFWVNRVGSFSASSLSNYMLWGVSQGVATVGSTIKVRKPSYSRQALGYTAPVPYQRVNTPADYDAIGFPKSLRVAVDDFYTCGGGGSTTGFYYSDVIRPTGSGSRTLFYNSVFGLKSGLLISLFSNKFNVAIGNGSAYVPLLSAETLTNGELVHVAAWDDLTNVYLQINGGTIQSMARPAMPAGPPTINLYNTGAFEHFNGSITEPIYRAGPPPNAYERDVIRNYQRQKAGML